MSADDYDGLGTPLEPKVDARSRKEKLGTVPLVVAAMLDEHQYVESPQALIHDYNGRYWQPVSNATLKARALLADPTTAQNNNKRSEIIGRLRAECHRENLQWGRVADHEVPCESGVIDLLTGDEVEGWQLRPHRSDDWLDSIIPVAYRAGAKCPVWGQCLDDWFEIDSFDGAQCITALQEWFGYICLPHARFKKALICYGPGDTGKSQPIMLMKALVGDEFYASLPVTEMNDPRRLWVLVGKRLNVMTELTSDAMVADGGFKTLVSTEEPVLVDPKYREPYSFVPIAKHAIATNALPRINDKTEATFNRLLLIPFRNVLPKNCQDRQIMEKLRAELEGIFLWALQGARRLTINKGQWSNVAAAQELMTELKAESNPVKGFIEEEMEYMAGARTRCSEILVRFNASRPARHQWSPERFGKALREAGFSVSKLSAGRVLDDRIWRIEERNPPSGAYRDEDKR